MRRLSLRIATAAAALALMAWSAHADWLVTVDGTRVETEGPWEVKGRQVIFTLANGSLSSMRLSEIDLEASEAATAAAEAPPEDDVEAATEAPREARIEITNRDIPPASTAAATTGEGTTGDAEEGAGAATAGGSAPRSGGRRSANNAAPVVVTEPFSVQGLRIAPTGEDAVRVSATLLNDGEEKAERLRVLVRLFSDAVLFGEAPARLSSTTLRPQAATLFSADFQDVFIVAGQESYRVEVEVVLGRQP